MNPKNKKIKLSLPPVFPNFEDQAMIEMINKGGSTLAKKIKEQEPPQVDKLKSFTFKIYESELSKIREIQSRLTKRDRISIHDFVLAGVLEKINKEH